MRRKIAITLMSVGVIFVGFAMGLTTGNYLTEAIQALKVVCKDPYVVGSDFVGEEINDIEELKMVIKEIDGYGYIGYLSIPALQLDLPVMSEWDYGRLKISPCRYYGSTKTDNLVIAAHNYRFHFGYLGHLKIGDTVVFTDMESEKHIYQVTSVEQLMPTDVDKVKDSGDDLILYTCTYGGAKRITVRCSYAE